MKSFGQVIAEARKAKRMSQRELASSIERTSGVRGISAAYLNDIEHNRRNPSDEFLILQFASHLDIDPNYALLLASRQMPGELVEKAQAADPQRYKAALLAFRKVLEKK